VATAEQPEQPPIWIRLDSGCHKHGASSRRCMSARWASSIVSSTPLVFHPGHQPPRPYDIRTIQELLGHKDVATTMISTHVLNSVRSPLND